MMQNIFSQDRIRIIETEKRVIQAQSDAERAKCCPFWRTVLLKDADKRIIQSQSNERIARIMCECDKVRFCGCQNMPSPLIF